MELNNWPTRAEDIARWAQGAWNRKPDREQTQWMANRIAELEKHAHELLHWIYPRHGDPELRTQNFVTETIVGFMLLGEEHPFENVEVEEKLARAALTDKKGGRG